MTNKKKPCKDPNNTEEGKLCYYFNKKFGCALCTSKYKPKTKTKKVRQKIKQVSSKRARMNKMYSVMRRLFLKDRTCEFPNCSRKHTEDNQLTVHHKKGRNGERLLDTTYWMAVCMEHHKYIEEHREESFEKGWLINRNKEI